MDIDVCVCVYNYKILSISISISIQTKICYVLALKSSVRFVDRTMYANPWKWYVWTHWFLENLYTYIDTHTYISNKIRRLSHTWNDIRRESYSEKLKSVTNLYPFIKLSNDWKKNSQQHAAFSMSITCTHGFLFADLSKTSFGGIDSRFW